MSKTNKTVAVVVGGKTLGFGSIESNPAYGNEVVRGIAHSSNSGVWGDKGGWFAYVPTDKGLVLKAAEVVEAEEVGLVDLATADLDALLG